MNLEGFIDYFKRWGAEYFLRYYGPYKAVVTENVDPENRGRVQVECVRARLLKDNNIWLTPMDSSGGASGQFWPPIKGALVWIFFDNGDPSRPLCYSGGLYGQGLKTGEASTGVAELLKPVGIPTKRGWATPRGNVISLDDKQDEETIIIRQKSGKIVKISPTKVSIGTEGGDFEPLLLGSQVQKWLDNHIHNSSWGPTSPPMEPLPASALSKDTETS